jgi:hypothetical protein
MDLPVTEALLNCCVLCETVLSQLTTDLCNKMDNPP